MDVLLDDYMLHYDGGVVQDVWGSEGVPAEIGGGKMPGTT